MLGPAAWRRSLVVAIDLVVVAWTLCMLALAGAVSTEIDRIGGVADSMSATASAETALATALGPLASIPFVNLNLGGAQHQLDEAAASTSAGAVSTRSAVRSLSRTSGLVVVLLALFPLLVFYLPLRMVRVAAIRSQRRDLRRYGRSPEFVAYLAHRALLGMSFDDLRRITPDPAGDLAAGRYGALAQAELRRTGAIRPAVNDTRRGPTPA